MIEASAVPSAAVLDLLDDLEATGPAAHSFVLLRHGRTVARAGGNEVAARDDVGFTRAEHPTARLLRIPR